MNFDKEAKSDKNKFGEEGWGGGGGGGGDRALKPKQYARLCPVSNEVKKMQLSNLHNVEHVVQSTFQNTLISF